MSIAGGTLRSLGVAEVWGAPEVHLEVWLLFTLLLSFRLWTRAPLLVCCLSSVRVFCPVRPYVVLLFVCLFVCLRHTRSSGRLRLPETGSWRNAATAMGSDSAEPTYGGAGRLNSALSLLLVLLFLRRACRLQHRAEKLGIGPANMARSAARSAPLEFFLGSHTRSTLSF